MNKRNSLNLMKLPDLKNKEKRRPRGPNYPKVHLSKIWNSTSLNMLITQKPNLSSSINKQVKGCTNKARKRQNGTRKRYRKVLGIKIKVSSIGISRRILGHLL